MRKLQLTGGSSYTVTVPKEWVARSKLGGGDAVGVLEHPDGSLSLVPHPSVRPATSRYEVHVGAEGTEAAFRNIVAAYLMGYDVIAVKASKVHVPDTRRAARMAAKRIIGLEVVEEDAHGVTLQDFLDPREFHIEKGLRRMQAITRAMQEDALASLRGEGEAAEGMNERDDEVDRLYWMVNKQFHAILRDPAYAQRAELTASQALNYLLVARVIERTADHARRIADNLGALEGADLKARLASKIEKHAERAFALFDAALAAFLKKDAEASNRIIEDATTFQRSQDSLIQESLSLGGEEILHVAYALESVGRTAAYAADVAETAINHRVAMAS